MSSQRKIDSARANGARSHGPVTPEGLERCARAHLTHGLTSARMVLDNESEDEFLALRDDYYLELQPQTRIERDLVDQLIAARWRLDRAWSVETALLDLEMVRQEPDVLKEFEACNAQTRTALAFRALCDGSRTLAAVNRHEARFRLTFDRVLKIFASHRENQKNAHGPNPKNEHSPAPPEPWS